MEHSTRPDRANTRKDNIRQLLIDLGIMTVIGVVLAFVGPFGSFDDPLAWRLIYWLGYAYAGYACYRPVTVLAAYLSQRLDLPEWALVIVGVLVGTIPMSVIVWVLGRAPSGITWPTVEQALTNYFYVAVIGGGVTLLFYAIDRQPGGRRRAPDTLPPPPATSPAEPSASTIRLFDRLPAHLGTDLLALEMEDHYVRVHTALGSELILLRLRDAVVETEGLDGAQVHRSWWVARDAVSDVKREGRNVRLILDGGLEAPVSRARLPELKEAGWL